MLHKHWSLAGIASRVVVGVCAIALSDAALAQSHCESRSDGRVCWMKRLALLAGPGVSSRP